MKLMNEYDGIIAKEAQAFNLPAALIAAIITIESGGDNHAMRYEPAFEARYLKKSLLAIKTIAPCSEATERIARACSWGLMQVMGQVARERGYDGPFLSALGEPAIGIHYGCKHLAMKYKSYFHNNGWPGVISAYNAGIPKPNSAYAAKMMNLWTP